MNDQNKRLFLTIAMCLAVAYVWSVLFAPKPRPPGSKAPAVASAPVDPAAAKDGAPGAGVPAGTASGPRATAPSPAGTDVPRGTFPRPATQKLTVTSEKLKLVISTDGAVLESIELLGVKFRHRSVTKGQADVQVELVSPSARPLPLTTSLTSAAGAVLLGADAGYEVVEHGERSATLRARVPGFEITKRLVLDPKSYKIDVAVDVRADAAFDGHLTISSTGYADPNVSSGMFSARSDPNQTMCKAGDKTERLTVGAKTPSWDGPGPAVFAGISEPYFLTALVPAAGTPANCHIDADPKGTLRASLDYAVKAAPDAVESRKLVYFAGPKDTEELAAVAAPLQESVDFGFWAVIANFLLAVMKFFYKAVPPHNWGIAIILLTLAVKAVTFPLQHKSMKSMQEMQRIQPQLEEMKKKYAGDTQRQNQEQMKLFQEHGVNPMGGCLPMLIQMPVWFALYTTLRVSVELYNSMFIPGWLTDLTARDPYYILPVAMGITMLLTQILTPQPMSNPSQKTIGYAMTGFFSLMMLNLPSGLTLYIFVNNVLSIAQQMYLRRTLKVGGPTVSALGGAKKA